MMNNYLLFLLEMSCVFTIQYLFYLLLLSRLTFHTVNRTVLLSIIFFSVFIPLLRINHLPLMYGNVSVPDFSAGFALPQGSNGPNPETSSVFNLRSILLLVYLTGAAVFLYRLVASAFRLILFVKKAKTVKRNGCIITTRMPVAFSCFKYIFLPAGLSVKNREMVIKHESIHASFYHTYDLILMELFVACLWFHPFVYLFRKSIRAVHEFQVDHTMIKHHESRRNYMKLMLQNLDIPAQRVGLYNYFNGLTLKKRIHMITQPKSNKLQISRYLLLLPVMGMLIMSFGIHYNEKPDLFPLKKGSYEKITSNHGDVFRNPFTQKEVTHRGLDIKAPEGTEIFSAGAGKVIKASAEKGWGNLLVLDHGNGYETWYAHLQGFNVETGQQVARGDVIAKVGNTGYSTGPHLHFEIRYKGESLDPLNCMAE